MIANPLALPRAELRIIGPIWTGRALSHFYMLVLPPPFPLIRADLDVSWTDLGLPIAVYSVSTGIAQIPAGILVDRIGARPVLFAGLLGLLFAAVAALNRDALSDRAIGVAAGRKGGAADARPSVIGVLTSAPVLLFLLALTSLGVLGVHVPDARREFDGLSSVLGAPWSMLIPAIFALILVSFAAGAIADRVGNRERLAAICLVASAVSFGMTEFDFQPVPIAVWLAAGALLAAPAGPAIDLLVLRVCPSGRIGTVFGMVAICRSIGRALSAWAAGASTGSGMPGTLVRLSALSVLLAIVCIYAAKAVAR